jgi:hypothetical protein
VGLTESYRAHLAGRTDADLLRRDLHDAGLFLEAGLWAGAVGSSDHAVVDDPTSWLVGRRVWTGAFPPGDAGAGDVWFDPYELSAMVLIPREPLEADGDPPTMGEGFDPRLVWLATRPVLQFQYSAFLDLAPLEPRRWEGRADLGLFERPRAGRRPTEPVTGLVRGEAYLYARWFGKSLPTTFEWTCARSALPTTAFSALWHWSEREWTATSPVVDPDMGLVVSEDDVDIDPDTLQGEDEEWLTPDSHESLFGPWDRADDVGSRTAVPVDVGVLAPASYGDRIAVGDVCLAAPLPRRAGAAPG